ncbi:MAG: Ig-like domain-containing protein, partial [bacterium]
GGAKLQLNYVGTRQVAALTFNAGSAQANGTYGSSSSPATFKNDSYFGGSGTVTVGPVTGTSSTTLALTGGGSPSDFGVPLTFTATVAGSTPTGNVAFYADGMPLGAATLTGSFEARVTTSSLTFGSHRITAQYAGDANQSPSTSASLAVLINTPVNDAPVAFGQSVSTAEDTALPITLAASDTDGDALTYTIVTPPAYGTLSGTPPNVTYTPAPNYHGADSFTFMASDRYADSAATVSLTVTPVNDAPVAAAQTVSTAAKTARAITLAASDVDGDALSYIIVTQPAHGTLGGSAPNVTYTPATNYTGTDSFTFKANDGTADSTAAAVSVIVFQPPSGLPVVEGLTVWLKADAVNTANTSQVRVVGSNTFVKQWIDQSGGGHHATQATDAKQPKYIASGVNGKPVLRFVEASDNKLYLGELSASFPTAGSMFAVSTINTDGRYSLFDNRDNDSRWVANTWSESQPGVFRGSRTGMTYASWPQSGSHVFAMESGSSTYRFVIDGSQIGSAGGNYHNGSGQNWTIGDRPGDGQQLNGDIPEFILYNRVLASDEANAVGRYLADTYGLTTTYVATPPQARILGFGIPGSPAVINESAKTIAWTVPYGTSLATLAPAFALSVGATCNQPDSSVPTPNFSGGPVHYVVTAADPLVTADYTVTVTVTPIGTAKDMLTFGLPSLPADIDGTNIAWSVPYGTDLATLAPAYTVSPYASGSPASNTTPNFAVNNPATYTITAQDGSTRIYHVTVSVLPESPVTINLAYMNTMGGPKSWEQKGTASKAAPLAYTGTNWNNGGNGSAAVSNLKKSNGADSGISVSAVLRPRATGVAWGSILGGNKLASYPAGLGLGQWAAGDSAIRSGFVDVLTFSGLATTHSYNLCLVTGTGQARFQYLTQTAHVISTGTPADWVCNDHYALLTDCIPNASGEITIQETIPGDWAGLCGWQILDNGFSGPTGTVMIIF